MARRLRSAIILLLLSIVALTVALWPQLLSYGAQYALRSAQSPSLRLSWSGATGSRSGVSFESIDALVAVSTGGNGRLKALPLRLSFSNVQVQPSVVSALLNQQAATFSADIFGGSISGSVSGALSKPGASIAWSRIDVASLALFPEVRALGLRQGTMEGTATFSDFVPNQPPRAVFSATFRDFNIPNSPIHSVLKLQPDDLVTVAVSGSSTADTVSLEPLSVTSAFGKAESRGTITLAPQIGVRDVSLTTSVSLTDSGSEKFGAWLPLLTNNLVQAGTRSFTLRSRTVPCSGAGNVQVLNLGGRSLCFSNRVERAG